MTMLDDTPMGRIDGHDVWTDYLTGPKPTLSIGWCVGEAWYIGMRFASIYTPSLISSLDQPLCSGYPKDSKMPLTCFMSASQALPGRLIDPVPILTGQEAHTRCHESCGAGDVCILPEEGEQLLRLSVIKESNEEVVLWSGPGMEVWEQR